MRSAATIVAIVTLGLAAYCCGPKVKPALDYRCPGETCEQDALGEHNCVCPE